VDIVLGVYVCVDNKIRNCNDLAERGLLRDPKELNFYFLIFFPYLVGRSFFQSSSLLLLTRITT